MDVFWYWCNERHRIHLLKSSGQPWPWTDDPIFQRYKFCQVFRELDKVTTWLRVNWREPYAEHPNLWMMMCLARVINWPPTLQEIVERTNFPDEWEPDAIVRVMQDRQKRGEKVYTGAYMLRGDIWREYAVTNDKPTYTVKSVLNQLWVDRGNVAPRKDDTIRSFTKRLAAYPGWGGFLAYEVATDLRWTHYLRDATDIMTWANAGPGAQRGLCRVFGLPLKTQLPEDESVHMMRDLLKASVTRLEPHVPAFEMRDIEGACCEVDKYLRVLNGEGKPRALYSSNKPPEF
jgi:hypothetical protein